MSQEDEIATPLGPMPWSAIDAMAADPTWSAAADAAANSANGSGNGAPSGDRDAAQPQLAGAAGASTEVHSSASLRRWISPHFRCLRPNAVHSEPANALDRRTRNNVLSCELLASSFSSRESQSSQQAWHNLLCRLAALPR